MWRSLFHRFEEANVNKKNSQKQRLCYYLVNSKIVKVKKDLIEVLVKLVGTTTPLFFSTRLRLCSSTSSLFSKKKIDRSRNVPRETCYLSLITHLPTMAATKYMGKPNGNTSQRTTACFNIITVKSIGVDRH